MAACAETDAVITHTLVPVRRLLDTGRSILAAQPAGITRKIVQLVLGDWSHVLVMTHNHRYLTQF